MCIIQNDAFYAVQIFLRKIKDKLFLFAPMSAVGQKEIKKKKKGRAFHFCQPLSN